MINNKKENPMRKIEIEKVIVHCSTAEPAKLERSKKLLKYLTKHEPIETLAKKRIPTWKIKPGQPIGCMVTLRKKEAIDFLKTVLVGVRELKEKQFNNGFLTFGIKEYIEIPAFPYQREIGILGFDVIVTLKRKGWSIKERKKMKKKIPLKHRITKEETISFFKNNFNIKIAK